MPKKGEIWKDLKEKSKQKEPSVGLRLVTGGGQFLIANDTAARIYSGLGDKGAIVELDAKGMDCGQVMKEIKSKEELTDLALNKAVLVGNAVVVRNVRDLHSQFGVYLCLGHERYNPGTMSRFLGYDDLESTEVTHTGIDLMSFMGREHGYMSFVLAGKHLRYISGVVTSDGFWKKAYRQSTLLGCDIGDGFYLAGEGKSLIDRFMEINGRIIRESEYR